MPGVLSRDCGLDHEWWDPINGLVASISLKTWNPSLIGKSHARLHINSVSFPVCFTVAELACPKQKQRKPVRTTPQTTLKSSNVNSIVVPLVATTTAEHLTCIRLGAKCLTCVIRAH